MIGLRCLLNILLALFYACVVIFVLLELYICTALVSCDLPTLSL